MAFCQETGAEEIVAENHDTAASYAEVIVAEVCRVRGVWQ